MKNADSFMEASYWRIFSSFISFDFASLLFLSYLCVLSDYSLYCLYYVSSTAIGTLQVIEYLHLSQKRER